MKRHALITLLLLAIALTPATSHARAVHVVRVDGPRVSARDVLGAGVAAVDLGMAPQPGFRRRIEATRLRRLVPGAKTAARAYLVETRAQTLGCATLRARVSAALSLPAGLRVVRLDCARGLTLAAGAIRVGAELVGQRQIGAVLLRVTLRAGRWPAQQRVMSARVDGRVRVAMTVRAVGRGEALASSVEMRMARAATLPPDAIFSLAEVHEARARAGLRAGVVLRRAAIQPIPLVRRGSTVTLVVVSGGFKITNRGVARRDGARGETVAVFCQGSGRTIRARVVARQRLRVDL